jgi:TonB family protein
MLGPGVPDLVKGRRPVPPPLARMAGTTGSVEVRFSVDAGGQASVKSSEGPELLKPAAEEAVRTWSFRRTTTERLHMVASFSYSNDAATVLVNLEP